MLCSYTKYDICIFGCSSHVENIRGDIHGTLKAEKKHLKFYACISLKKSSDEYFYTFIKIFNKFSKPNLML